MQYTNYLTILYFLSTIGCPSSSGQDLSSIEKQEGASQQRSTFDLKDETDYVPIAAAQDSGGMRIAAGKDSDSIRELKSINGLPISEIEKLMRPKNKDERSSKVGFLGPEENLIGLLVADNDFVHSQGLTHRELAIPRSQLFGKARQNWTESPPGSSRYTATFAHAGKNWGVAIAVTDGLQYAPFNDGARASADFVITNLDNGKSLRVAELVPIMIEKYGFYEGHGTMYRVPPQKIIELLEIASGGKKDE